MFVPPDVASECRGIYGGLNGEEGVWDPFGGGETEGLTLLEGGWEGEAESLWFSPDNGLIGLECLVARVYESLPLLKSASEARKDGWKFGYLKKHMIIKMLPII